MTDKIKHQIKDIAIEQTVPFPIMAKCGTCEKISVDIVRVINLPGIFYCKSCVSNTNRGL